MWYEIHSDWIRLWGNRVFIVYEYHIRLSFEYHERGTELFIHSIFHVFILAQRKPVEVRFYVHWNCTFYSVFFQTPKIYIFWWKIKLYAQFTQSFWTRNVFGKCSTLKKKHHIIHFSFLPISWDGSKPNAKYEMAKFMTTYFQRFS